MTCKLHMSLFFCLGALALEVRADLSVARVQSLASGVIQALALQHHAAGGQLNSLRSLCLGCSHLTEAARDLPALYLDLSCNRNYQVWKKVRPLGVSGKGQSGQYLRQN